MPATARKRKSQACGDEPTKRLRIEKPLPSPVGTPLDFGDEDEDDDYKVARYSSSGDERTVETPVTPFSPARKVFPSQLKTLKCTYEGCTKSFNRPIRLESHLRSHTNERPFTCTYEGCDKAYLEDKHLQQHIKGSHTHERNFQCDWEGCTKSFLTSTRLKRHKEAHEGHERFRCTEYPPCNQTFRKHQTLQRHIRADHLQLAPFPCTFVDPITLEACHAGFDGAGGLRKHEERVHGGARFFCTECTIPKAFDLDGAPIYPGFTTSAQLQSHIKKDHANCLFCDMKCSSQRELQRHIDSQHSNTTLEERKIIPCTYDGCSKTFTKRYNLTVHIRTVHKGERFICGTFDVSSTPGLESFTGDPSCTRDFVSKQNLEDHVRTAHLSLPSVVNANRVKPEPTSDVEDDGDDDFEPRSRRGRRKCQKGKASAIDELLGDSYISNPYRTIPCIFPDCRHRFIRNYDLEVHLRSGHHQASEATPHPEGAYLPDQPVLPYEGYQSLAATGPSQHEDGDQELFRSFTEQADMNWELERRALEGGPFWIGADDDDSGGQTGAPDQWVQEELEMRSLVGDEGMIDPSLRGL